MTFRSEGVDVMRVLVMHGELLVGMGDDGQPQEALTG
jgi:hypothetical protein